jgi:gamma-glutamyltranspeptidase / glutathione hydrolase
MARRREYTVLSGPRRYDVRPRSFSSPHRSVLLLGVAWILLAIGAASAAEPAGLAERRPGFAAGARGAVAAEHALAAEAGIEMLAGGGNAIDGAVAAAFVNGVVNPSSCGIGGGGFLLVFTAGDGRTRALDFRERAPERAHRDMYVKDGEVDPRASLRGGTAVAVPGEVRGLAEALATLGTLPLARVLEPAIRHAGDGFPIGEHLAGMIARNRDEIAKSPELAAIYLRPDGSAPAPGERLVQRDLAATLRRIAADGPESFYSGDVAGTIVEAVNRSGGRMTKRDLIAYRPVWRDPLAIRLGDVEVLGFPPPSSGGGVILEILNVLAELRRESAPGTPFLGDPLSYHLLAESSKLAFADRALHYGDPDFARVPLDRLLSREHARALAAKISAKALAPSPAGTAAPEQAGTAHLSTIDAAGNAAALTTTVNTAFGAMIVAPGTGIVLNNQMDDFAAAPGVANVYGLVGAEANSIRPGKRPLSSMSPTIVRRGGRVELALGGSGGPFIISATLQTLLHVLDGAPLDRAIAAPRIHHQWRPDRVFVEPDLDAETRRALEQRGHPIAEFEEIGAVQAVGRVPGGFAGAADLRKGGDAAAW